MFKPCQIRIWFEVVEDMLQFLHKTNNGHKLHLLIDLVKKYALQNK